VREARGDEAAEKYAQYAERARASFNARFGYEADGHLFDVVDGEKGDDPACPPNRLFAFSLDHEVLNRSRWEPVLEVVRRMIRGFSGRADRLFRARGIDPFTRGRGSLATPVC
jgi:glycogen debranching enzyme